MAQFGSAPALGAGGRRFKSYLSDHIKGYIMSINKNKSNRIKFGHFSSESEAQAELARREKSLPRNLTGDFRVLKLPNKKSGKRNWMAYALVRKSGE